MKGVVQGQLFTSLQIRIAILLIITLGGYWYLAQKIVMFSAFADDGAYAYVAQRIIEGDVLNKDIQDIHAGYVNFANALALKAFGSNLLSLRIPLLLLTLIQSSLIFWWISKYNLVSGLVAGAIMIGLTFVQFVNPSANWYCLFLVVVLGVVLSSAKRLSPKILLLAGFLVACIFLFRQLSGVIAGCGVLLVALVKSSEEVKSSERIVALCCLGAILVVLLFVLTRSGSPGGAIIIGIGPILLLLNLIVSLRAPNLQLAKVLLWLLVGFVLGLVPLLIYHSLNNSLVTWWNDVFIAAINMSDQDYISDASYLEVIFTAFFDLLGNPGFIAALSTIFWITLVMVPGLLGIVFVRKLIMQQKSAHSPFIYIVLTYSLVAVHYQVFIYLLFVVGLCFVALLLLTCQSTPLSRMAVYGLSVYCLVIGVVFHAGKSWDPRNLNDILRAERNAEAITCDIRRIGVQIKPRDCSRYLEYMNVIDKNTSDTDSILVLPLGPEVYFFSEKNAPVRFFNAVFGITNENLEATLNDVKNSPPKIVFFDRENKRKNSPESRSFANKLLIDYDFIGHTAEYEVYRLVYE